MKFATVHYKNQTLMGLVQGESIYLGQPGETLKAMLAGEGVDAAARRLSQQEAIPLTEVTFAPVIPDPEHIFCAGLNYQHHRDETRPEHRKAYPDYPVIFMRFASTLTGHQQPVIHPTNSHIVDYEGELAVIIGKPGRHIATENALDHVAGVTCFNDVSMRDWQMRSEQWGPGKNFPTSGPMGPWMVTLDETGPLQELELRTLLNGKVMQRSRLDFMIFDIPALIAYCSEFCQLRSGDIIVTGTPGGVGFTRKPMELLTPGSTCVVEIDRVGKLENRIIAE